MNDIQKLYAEWTEKVIDPEVAAQLQALAKDENALKNAFFKNISFGTGGLRGELGAGTNCLNVYTVRKVTQGIANCMKAHGYQTAAISYDSRINSEVFARAAASVFAANGLTAYITKELMPTPFLSYITRSLKADVGVMITASHNPAKYNGYKVYGADGCQLTDAGALEMTDYIEAVDIFSVQSETFDSYLAQGAIRFVDDALIEGFLNEVYALHRGNAEGLSITYTPLNGTGYKLVPAILQRMGAQNVQIVAEQAYPDGNFTTCPYPNPEKAEALKLGLAYAEKANSDLLLATDPDCDRVGIAVKTADGYKLMTGNEVGALLADYLLSARKADGSLPQAPVLVKTIVTTELVRKIAAEYNAEVWDVLTGFKYIGEIIGKLEKTGETERFVLGFEESYGYLSGSYVRDKDGVNGCMMIVEMAAYYKKQGKTLVDRMNELYEKYGLFEHKLLSYEFAGAKGNAEMQNRLQNFRNNIPATFGGETVVKTVDYLTQTEMDLPKSNVLSLFMQDGSQVVVRPSGTEPLIKVYLTVTKNKTENEKKLALLCGEVGALFGV